MSNPPQDHDSHPTEPLELGENVPPAEDPDAAHAASDFSDDDADTLPIPIVTPTVEQPAAGRSEEEPAHGEGETADDSAPAPKPPRRRRHRRGGLIAVIVLVVVVVAGAVGWFVGDAWARDAVVSTAQEKTREVLGLPEDHPVTVRTGGLMLPQLVMGSLDKLTILTDDVPIGSITADVRLEASNVATYGDPSVGSATARVIVPADEAAPLLTRSTGLSVVGAELASPNVTLEYSRDHFLSRVQVAVTLQPSVSAGQLVLTPQEFDVAGSPTTPQEIRDRFGGIAPPMLEARTLCVAGVLPKALTLTGVTVRGDAIDLDTDVDPRVVDDSSLRETGSCG